jgi:predicted N-acetyltransferase YhbS
MTHDLDIHAATSDELVAAHRNVFDIWGKGLSLDEHVQSRLNSPSHRRAAWFVGTLAGRVVTSLACYPMRFRVLGQELPGIAIGSLYTLAEFRGRSFAPRLLGWVENHAREAQAALSVLYCDIDPSYYERLGYTLCPSLEGWCDPQDIPPAKGATHRLVPLSSETDLPAIKKLYADYHGAAPLSVARDSEYWAMLLKKYAGDEFFALEDSKGTWQGYARLGRKGQAWRITDFALVDQSDALAAELYAAIVELARSRGASRVGGWLSGSGAAKQFFEFTPRRTEITMIKPLVWSGVLDHDLIAETSRFCKIDHV